MFFISNSMNSDIINIKNVNSMWLAEAEIYVTFSDGEETALSFEDEADAKRDFMSLMDMVKSFNNK